MGILHEVFIKLPWLHLAYKHPWKQWREPNELGGRDNCTELTPWSAGRWLQTHFPQGLTSQLIDTECSMHAIKVSSDFCSLCPSRVCICAWRKGSDMKEPTPRCQKGFLCTQQMAYLSSRTFNKRNQVISVP